MSRPAAIAGEPAEGTSLHQAQQAATAGRASAAVHDLSNLLGIVIGNLDLLNERPELEAETRELVCEALNAALRGSVLVQDISRARTRA